jgi:putative RNA 2'-phosphotransferase
MKRRNPLVHLSEWNFMDDYTRTRRSKMLSQWLRHKPERGGLTLSPEGWAAIPALLEAFQRAGHEMSRVDLEHLIRLDAKGRFEMEGDRVRARYGHSVELEAKPHPGMPPATLYHGTARRFLPKIMETGLKPMKRQFVHLSPDKKTAREVGRRRDQEPAILIIAAHRAHEAGVQFYPRGRGIWLSDPIPPEFLTVLEDSHDPAANTEERRAAPGTPRRRRPKGGFSKF